jgi:demethylmenaquinone methyltransferase / 2-methoxy-6-polyprenyl-1,4-benzoquinol methylase
MLLTRLNMANIFFDPGGKRAAKVHDLFARIAPRYDLINDLQSFGLHRYWKRRLLRLADPQPGALALDLCCGTGDIALALARRGAAVTGLDFSEEMLAVARRKTKFRDSNCERAPRPENSELGSEFQSQQSTVCDSGCVKPPIRQSLIPPLPLVPSPQFIRGDALQIQFPDNTFDIVTVGYGLRNLADMEAGLREMWRVAKPGGRLLVLDFGKPDNALWRRLYFAYLRLFVPMLGLVFCGSASAYAYILESLKYYPAQHGVAAKMRELGLAHVRIISFLGGIMSINFGEKP